MSHLIIYRLAKKTTFQRNIQLDNGYVLCCYLNTDLSTLLDKYNYLKKVKKTQKSNIKLSSDELDKLKGYLNYIDFFVSNLPPYDQLGKHHLPFDINKYDDISAAIDYYLSLLEGILRVEYYYKPYLEKYHFKNGLPNSIHDTVTQYKEFIDDIKNIYSSSEIPPYCTEPKITLQKTNSIIKREYNGKIVNSIWEQLEFTHVGDFLYNEFCDILRTFTIIKKCALCSNFFILKSHYNTDYCTNIAPNETVKTCRDIGAYKTYNDKVKSDPILLEYQRAYKTHYARISKGLMTKQYFFEWCDKALNLKNKVQNNQISFE